MKYNLDWCNFQDGYLNPLMVFSTFLFKVAYKYVPLLMGKYAIYIIFKIYELPWLVSLSGLSTVLWTKGSCSIPSQGTRLGCRPRHELSMFLSHIDVSLPLFFPPFYSL